MSDIKLPATLPADGNLPAAYQSAQKALAECSRVDEVKDWADKAAALASYARQANDHTLLNLAQRIQARALDRGRELLSQYPELHGGSRQPIQVAGGDNLKSRRQTAHEAGLSNRQYRATQALEHIPRDQFEAAVESDDPPSAGDLMALADRIRGRQPAEMAHVQPADPRHVAEATALLRQFASFCGTHDPLRIACAPAVDADLMRNYVSTIDRWLDRLVTHLPADEAA